MSELEMKKHFADVLLKKFPDLFNPELYDAETSLYILNHLVRTWVSFLGQKMNMPTNVEHFVFAIAEGILSKRVLFPLCHSKLEQGKIYEYCYSCTISSSRATQLCFLAGNKLFKVEPKPLEEIDLNPNEFFFRELKEESDE